MLLFFTYFFLKSVMGVNQNNCETITSRMNEKSLEQIKTFGHIIVYGKTFIMRFITDNNLNTLNNILYNLLLLKSFFSKTFIFCRRFEKSTYNMQYTCLGCNKVFPREMHFIRHMNNKTPCLVGQDLIMQILINMQKQNNKMSDNIDKLYENLKKLQEENEKLRKKNIEQDDHISKQNNNITKLNKKIKVLETKSISLINNSFNDNSKNITQNITLVNIGQENLKPIIDILRKDIESIFTKDPIESFENCMKKIYWNCDTPENRIIEYDEENNRLLIHKDDKWISKKGSFIIKNTSIFGKLKELFDSDFEKYEPVRKVFQLDPHMYNVENPIKSYNKKNIRKASKKIIDIAKEHS